MHEYLQQTGYKNPSDESDCAFQWTFNTRENYFHYLLGNEKRKNAFNDFMTKIRSTRHHWTDWYPVQREVLDDVQVEQDDMILIDMGGGKGHDLEVFLMKFPSAKGRILLQDLPGTVPQAKQLSHGIQVQAHDFFTTQTVRSKNKKLFLI